MAKFLITGGAGFIGSNLAEFLLGQGHQVRILDNFFSGKESNLAKVIRDVELIRGDIRDLTTAQNACRGVAAVMHQAALRSVPESMKNPASYNDVNINGVLTMLTACRDVGVKRFVFASSSSVYGDTLEFPQRESHYPLAMSPYALTKLAGEYYCRTFSKHFGIETVCLRYFNVFGPKQALDDQYAVVVPKFIDCIRKNLPPPIFGDGGQSRDFTYIENVVSANLLAATVPGITHEVVNVALGENNTVLKLAQTINHILGKNIQPQFLPIRAGDIYKSHADISKITKVLGYQPLVRFEEGVKRTVDYILAQS